MRQSVCESFFRCCRLIGRCLISQHAPVITPVETVTPIAESASAPPTQREIPVTGVRQVTGVTTSAQDARYTHTHTLRHLHTPGTGERSSSPVSLQPCSCSSAGSSAPQCHLLSGQCPCREGFSGRSCDRCAPGYYGYPECSACGCDVAGTDETFCNKTLGVCECGRTGECVCKVRTRTRTGYR